MGLQDTWWCRCPTTATDIEGKSTNFWFRIVLSEVEASVFILTLIIAEISVAAVVQLSPTRIEEDGYVYVFG